MFYVAALVFLFIIRTRFPVKKSIAEIIRGRYNDETLHKLRHFEKLDFKLRKVKLDTEFLDKCFKQGISPKFLHFKVANKSLRISVSYKKDAR